MNSQRLWICLFLCLPVLVSAQLKVKDSSGQNVLMVVADDGKVGIGKQTPAYKLDVNGTINTNGFRMTTGATNGYVLKSNATGTASWAQDAVNDADANPSNELPLAGNGISITQNRTVNVQAPTCNSAFERLVWTGTAFQCRTLASMRAYVDNAAIVPSLSASMSTIPYNEDSDGNFAWDLQNRFNTTTHTFVVPRNGYYHVSASLIAKVDPTCTPSSTSGIAVGVFVNNSRYLSGNNHRWSAGTYAQLMASGDVYATQGQAITVQVYQNSGCNVILDDPAPDPSEWRSLNTITIHEL